MPMKTKYTHSLMTQAIRQAFSWNDVARFFHVTTNSGAVKKHLRKVADFHKIPYSHFLGKRAMVLYHVPYEIVLQNNSRYHPCTVKKAILENELIPYVCAICDLPPLWHDKPLTLTLDHIDGNAADHRLENLRFVCPNCDTQSPTYAGKNGRRGKPKHSRKGIDHRQKENRRKLIRYVD